MKNNSLDVQAFIEEQRISRFQLTVVVLCFIVCVLDGLDTTVMGYIAPKLSEEWSLTPAQLSPVLAAALFGLAIGALVCGPMADKVGRKTVLLLSVFFFGAATIGSVWAEGVNQLTVLRFVAGLGLGGAMPNAITLTSEYSPSRRRGLMVTTMFCGFTVGSALGALVSAQMLPVYGWRSVLFLGGAIPFLFLPILVWQLPESVRFLAARDKGATRIGKTLQRIAPLPKNWDGTFSITQETRQQSSMSPLRLILSGELRAGTFLLWIAFFMSLLVIYLTYNWLPTMMKSVGMSLYQSSWVGALFQIGATVGALVLGLLIDRVKNGSSVVGSSYAIGALMLYLIGQNSENFIVLAICVAIMGFCTSGGMIAANVVAASYYPTPGRATGVSWAHGIGRMGAITGTYMGGSMLALNLGFSEIFSLLTIPCLIVAVSLWGLGIFQSRKNGYMAAAIAHSAV